MTQPVPAQKGPYAVTLEAGKSYAWCACGLSAGQPFCDGSHKDGAFRPLVFRQQVTEEVWLCGCKQTRDGPRCDGSHEAL